MIQKINNPNKISWNEISKRPEFKQANLNETVIQIFKEIQRNGDVAIRKYASYFDNVNSSNFKVSAESIAKSAEQIGQPLKKAIALAKSNIEKFHNAQIEPINKIETSNGVTCWRENRAIENVGIYIPGGSAPLFSTVLMLGIPAKSAGCKNIILCTPPDANGNVPSVILYTANLIGITEIYAIGGIQAIGALTFGTQTVPKVDKIFGPGNQFVTAAKQMALQFGVAIDLPAGPSELLIIADETADPEFIAADLLSQAEHGADSQVILLSTDVKMLDSVLKSIPKQLKLLPRKATAETALTNSKAILFDTIEQCLEFSNMYAPEHLILAVKSSENYLAKIANAGSVFLGNYSCESAGDYASGTNHTLPTNGFARNYSGVSVDSFIKKITFQNITAQGLQNIGPEIEILAEAEQLQGHKNAVSIRLKKLNNV